jgi:hypothetical protein
MRAGLLVAVTHEVLGDPLKTMSCSFSSHQCLDMQLSGKLLGKLLASYMQGIFRLLPATVTQLH